MIKNHQPTIFGDRIVAGLSSAEDGPMNFKNHDAAEIRLNRESFLGDVGIDPTDATLLQVTYGDNTDFNRYKVIDEEHLGEGILEPKSQTEADALVVFRPGHAIFLPLADCSGAIIYDQQNEILMVSHLGRHSVELNGGERSIQFLRDEFDSNPENLLVWLSPAVGKNSYPLDFFKGKGLQEVILEQLIKSGVNPSNIELSPVDTAEDPDYYSHSQYKAGKQDGDGRFAIVAMMSE